LLPTLAIAFVLVVLAFVLGRVSAGGGGDAAFSSAPTERTTTTTRVIRHTVASGESLLGIASKYRVSPEELAAANGITDANRLFVGQVLVIPESTSVTTGATTTTTTTTGK
jgi:LysM repeat protein